MSRGSRGRRARAEPRRSAAPARPLYGRAKPHRLFDLTERACACSDRRKVQPILNR
jgi:hypothetical protein